MGVEAACRLLAADVLVGVDVSVGVESACRPLSTDVLGVTPLTEAGMMGSDGVLAPGTTLALTIRFWIALMPLAASCSCVT